MFTTIEMFSHRCRPDYPYHYADVGTKKTSLFSYAKLFSSPFSKQGLAVNNVVLFLYDRLVMNGTSFIHLRAFQPTDYAHVLD